jgi:hypothetical protein
MVRKTLGKTRSPYVPELGDNRREWRRAALSSMPMTTEQSRSDTSSREWMPDQYAFSMEQTAEPYAKAGHQQLECHVVSVVPPP